MNNFYDTYCQKPSDNVALLLLEVYAGGCAMGLCGESCLARAISGNFLINFLEKIHKKGKITSNQHGLFAVMKAIKVAIKQ